MRAHLIVHRLNLLGRLVGHTILWIAATFPAIAQHLNPPAHPSTLRIGLWTLWHDKQITISPAPAATLRLCAACASTPLTQAIEVKAANSALTLTGNRQAAFVSLGGSFTLTAHNESLTLHNPLHVSARNGQLVLAVALPIESYVERVVASESGPADTLESLKALAIVARTFALHQPHGHADYDLCDSTHCQLLHWGAKPLLGPETKLGAPSFPQLLAERVGSHNPDPAALNQPNRSAAHAATLATAGETLWFRGQRASAWFHQNCGGRTASPSEVWPSAGHQPVPWLVSRADPYCTAIGVREWSATLSLSDLTAALAAAGLTPPGWTTLTVARRGESGRAVTLMIGPSEISTEDFRLAVGRALGWNKILSNWFEISRQGDHFLFHGRGTGHGVGLCQAGAAAMAAQGRDSAQIFAQYFPGATVNDEATGLAWQTLRGQGFVLESLDPAAASALPQLAQALAEAESRSGLQPAAPITIRAFPSTPAFRSATLAPGWVAAFTEANWIATQPLSTLATRKLLVSTLRHEFLHALVESQAASATPLWFREGLVELWSGDAPFAASTPTLKPEEIDRALAHATSAAQSEAAHRSAASLAQRLLTRCGRAQIVAWLHSGLPPTTQSDLR
jgi:stage II sporulation protein D